MTGPSNRPGTGAQSGAYQNAHGNLRGLLILLQKQLQSYAENIQTKRPQEAWEAVQNWVVGKNKMAIC